MAFVVEDGTGLADANSYASVEFADTYFEERGITAWAGEDSAKQNWLIQATDYANWLLTRSPCYDPLLTTQALAYPVDVDVMPLALLRATCQYALRAMAGPLMPDPVVDATGYAVVTTAKKVGPIEKEFTVVGSVTGRPPVMRSYPIPDALIRPLLCRASGGSRVIR